MGLPNTLLSIPAVANTLGSAVFELYDLFIHSAVNKWSKYKPFKNTTKFYLTTTELFNALQAANFGLTATEIAGLRASSLAGGTTSTLQPVSPAEWTYDKPTGATPCRLGDFRGYNHAAKPFIWGLPALIEWYSGVESLATLTWNPNFKWGDASYEGIGDTGNIDIPLTQLNIDSLPFSTAEWRIGLACTFGTQFYYIASSLAAIKDITSVNDVGNAFVNFDLDANFKAKLNALTSAEQTDLTLIPFLAYNLQYVTSNPSNKYFSWLSNGRSFCFPGGESAVTFRVYGGLKGTGLNVALSSIVIGYPSLSYSVSLNMSASTQAAATAVSKPSSVGYVAMQIKWRVALTNTTSKQRTFTISDLLLSPTILNQSIYNVTDSVSISSTITIAALGTKIVEFTVYESPGDSSRPFTDMIQGLPTYAGTDATCPYINFQVKKGSLVASTVSTRIKATA